MLAKLCTYIFVWSANDIFTNSNRLLIIHTNGNQILFTDLNTNLPDFTTRTLSFYYLRIEIDPTKLKASIKQSLFDTGRTLKFTEALHKFSFKKKEKYCLRFFSSDHN